MTRTAALSYGYHGGCQNKTKGFHALNSLQGYDFIFICYSFFCVTDWVGFEPIRPSSPLGDRAALGPRIAITCVLLLGLGYMAMIIMTLKKYGSQPGSTRTSPNLGIGNSRNAMQGLGGGAPVHWNTTQV